MSHNEDRATARRSSLTLQQYVSYQLAVRGGFTAIHCGGRLFQQLLVDYYCRTEGMRLQWLWCANMAVLICLLH